MGPRRQRAMGRACGPERGSGTDKRGRLVSHGGAREGGWASAGTGRAEEGAKRAGALVAGSCGADWAGAGRKREESWAQGGRGRSGPRQGLGRGFRAGFGLLWAGFSSLGFWAGLQGFGLGSHA